MTMWTRQHFDAESAAIGLGAELNTVARGQNDIVILKANDEKRRPESRRFFYRGQLA